MKIEKTPVGAFVKYRNAKYEASIGIENDSDTYLVVVDYDEKEKPYNLEILNDDINNMSDRDMLVEAYEIIKKEMAYLSHRKNILAQALVMLEDG